MKQVNVWVNYSKHFWVNYSGQCLVSILCGLNVKNTNSVQWWNKVGLGEREGEQSGAPPCIPPPEKFNLMALFRCARA